MDNYVGKILDARYASQCGQASTKRRRKPAIDLALAKYALQAGEEGRKATKRLDEDCKKQAIDQMNIFLFAGRDTSSSTVCFIYNMLSRHPKADERVRRNAMKSSEGYVTGSSSRIQIS
jgi:cytochrome P450